MTQTKAFNISGFFILLFCVHCERSIASCLVEKGYTLHTFAVKNGFRDAILDTWHRIVPYHLAGVRSHSAISLQAHSKTIVAACPGLCA